MGERRRFPGSSRCFWTAFRRGGLHRTCHPYGNVPVRPHSGKPEGPFLDRGGRRYGGQLAVAVAGQAQPVGRQGGGAAGQGAQAVRGQAVGRALRVRLRLRALRDPRGLHRRVPPRPRRPAVTVPGQHGRQAPAHVPFHVERGHAEGHVRLHVIGGVDVNRTDAQVGPVVPERAPDARGRPVGVDRRLRPHRLRSQAGADHVDAAGPGPGRDPVPVARPVHASVAHADVEVPGHPAAVRLPPQGPGRPVAVRRPRFPARGRGGDAGGRLPGGHGQVPAPAGPLLAQPRAGAGHQPPAGQVRARDLGHGVGNGRLGAGPERPRPSPGSPRMSAVLGADIRPGPAGPGSARMRTVVSMPLSPVSATRPTPERPRILSTWPGTVEGSDASPGKTSTATGRPSAAHGSP